jgi:hypothetical protein
MISKLFWIENFQTGIPAGDPIPLTAINTQSDKGYLIIHDSEEDQQETAYFMSEYNVHYDIWRAVSEKDKLIATRIVLN